MKTEQIRGELTRQLACGESVEALLPGYAASINRLLDLLAVSPVGGAPLAAAYRELASDVRATQQEIDGEVPHLT